MDNIKQWMLRSFTFLGLLCSAPVFSEATYFKTSDNKNNIDSHFISVPAVTALEQLDIPFDRLNLSIMMMCVQGDESLYFVFSETPNLLLNGQVINVELGGGATLMSVQGTHRLGSTKVAIPLSAPILEKLVQSDRLRVAFPWTGKSKVEFVFEYDNMNSVYTQFTNSCHQVPL